MRMRTAARTRSRSLYEVSIYRTARILNPCEGGREGYRPAGFPRRPDVVRTRRSPGRTEKSGRDKRGRFLVDL